MPVDIHFAGGETLRVASTYTKEQLALAFSGTEDRNTRVGHFLRVALDDQNEVLINPAGVAYLREHLS